MSHADLTLHQAAEVLGVHYMTAYRYVRLGTLSAVKSGGTWHVARADVEALRDAVPLAPTPSGRRRAPWSERLEARLVAGDGRGAWTVVEGAMTSGAGVDEVYLEVIGPAMRRIGARWAAGELDISVEHRATGLALRLMGRVSARFARRGRPRGTVVLGAPAGERHALPVAMLADLLRVDGWEVSDLGADLPPESFVAAAAATPDLVAVGLSVTLADHLPAAASTLAALRAAVPRPYLVVGGEAVRDAAHARALGADDWAASVHDLRCHLAARSSSTDRTGVR